MPEKPNKVMQFWEELKRRKVIHVIIVYATVAFVIVELVNNVFEPLKLPEWTPLMTIVILAIGFPVAIIISWIFDISLKGFSKTETIDHSHQSIEPVPRAVKTAHEKSIIVLPLEDISPDNDNEYFADGLTEEITADLSQINDLLVISRSSAMTFKGTKKKLDEIADEVNVRYVLEGSVRKAENKLRITAQLIDASSDTHLWAEKYDGTLDDVFDIQEKVSQDIVEALKLKLTTDERSRIAERPIDNFEAYDLYLRAYQEFWKFNEEALNRGLENLQDAIDIIGDNDLLYSAMALLYFQYVNMGLDHEEYISKSEEFAHKALALNPDSSTAYHVLGLIAGRIHGNPYEVIRHLKHALSIQPSLLPSLYSLIAFYSYTGKIPEATQLVERLKRIDPLSSQRYFFEGLLYFFDGNYKAALEPLRHYYEMEPENSLIWFYAWALAYCNEYKEAISVIDKGATIEANTGPVNFSQILKFTLLADKEKVLKLLTPDSQKTCKRGEAASYFISGIFAFLGENDKALDWLENAVDRGFLNYPVMAEKDPFLENIREEERFKKLVKKAKPLWENFEV